MTLMVCASLVGCAPPVSTMRVGGVFPARAASCSLELRTGGITPELLSSHDVIGTITVLGDDGDAPNDPRLLALVKPEACGLGGEVVLVAASLSHDNPESLNRSSTHVYSVLRAKSTAVPTQTF
jgi:hypothetical protein